MDNVETNWLLTEIYFCVVEAATRKTQASHSRATFNSQIPMTTSEKCKTTCSTLTPLGGGGSTGSY